MHGRNVRRLAAIATLGFLAGCGGGGAGGAGDGMGTVSFAMTDAPFPATEDCLSAVLVEIDGVKMKGTSDWVDVPLVGGEGSTVTLDLFQLRAGLQEALAGGQVPADTYSEVRLHIVRSVLQFADGSPERELKIPSGSSSGLKIKVDPPFELASGATADLLLDMDLGGSFHCTGSGGAPTCDDLKAGKNKVIFHPVIHAHHMADVATVSGLVLDATGAPVGAVSVAAYPAGTVLDGVVQPTAASFSASAGGEAPEGGYALVLPPGSYDLYASPPGANLPALVASAVALSAGEALALDLTLP